MTLNTEFATEVQTLDDAFLAEVGGGGDLNTI